MDGRVRRVGGAVLTHLPLKMASVHIVYKGREKHDLNPCLIHTPTTVQKHQI